MNASDRGTQAGPQPPPGTGNGDTRSIADLIKELRDEARTLVRQEVALAQAELSQKARRLLRSGIVLAAGVGLAAVAGLFLLAAIGYGVHAGLVVAGLSVWISNWLAPLLVAVVLGAVGLVLILKGRATLYREAGLPEKTVESLKEDKTWLMHRIK